MTPDPYEPPRTPTAAGDESFEPTAGRTPGWAALIGLLLPGLGHVYLGLGTLGLVAMFTATIGVTGFLLVALVLGVEPGIAMLAFIVLAIATRITVAWHGWWLARRRQTVSCSAVPSAWRYAGFIALSLFVGNLAIVVRQSMVSVHENTSSSGRPTLVEGDHLVVTSFERRDSAPERGDLVVFPLPDAPSTLFIKRVIGLPGERVTIEGGSRIEIEGRELPQADCSDGEDCREERVEGGRYRIRAGSTGLLEAPATIDFDVPRGHVFVLGDNRLESHDSRMFGPVPLDSIVGRTRSIVWPMARFSSVEPDSD